MPEPTPNSSAPQPLLAIDDLAVSFPGPSRGQRLAAVDGVSMAVYPRQTLAVVGESGSGKSVSAMSVLQLIPVPPGRYDRGQIWWNPGEERGQGAEGPRGRGKDQDGDKSTHSAPGPLGPSALSPPDDLLRRSDKRMRKVRGNQIAMIFQEPMTSLNPVYTIGEQILEAVRLHQAVGRGEAVRIAESALGDVGIADPSSRLKEYPHQLSGGMRQRVMIAMALACQPRLLLADEPTTALDVTIQAQILELLRRLQREKDMSIMLITHDLGVVAENADTVAVMYAGRVVEHAAVETIFGRPLHPYTRGLLQSMPVIGRPARRLPTVADGATIPEDFPSGYKASPHVTDPGPGRRYGGPDAHLHEVEANHWVLCEAVSDGAKQTRTPPRLAYRRAPATPGAAP